MAKLWIEVRMAKMRTTTRTTARARFQSNQRFGNLHCWVTVAIPSMRSKSGWAWRDVRRSGKKQMQEPISQNPMILCYQTTTGSCACWNRRFTHHMRADLQQSGSLSCSSSWLLEWSGNITATASVPWDVKQTHLHAGRYVHAVHSSWLPIKKRVYKYALHHMSVSTRICNSVAVVH